MEYLATFSIISLASIVYFSFFWLLSIKVKKFWMADIAWATGFFVIYLFSYIINSSGGFKQNLLLFLLFFWGIRLCVYLTIKNWNKEDFRYQQFKNRWGKNLVRNSYLQIFIPQSLLLVLINAGAIIATLSSENPQITIADVAIVILWLLGFLIESISDLQLYKFKYNTNNHNKVLNKGLWKYSRHPNYLGEIIMWSSIFLLVISFKNGIYGIISPILISYLLVKVSGIKLVEKKLSQNSEYKEYMENTPMLVPSLKTFKLKK